MKTTFRQVVVEREVRSLIAFDHKAFCAYPAEWFEAQDWRRYECWWLLVESRKVGCCAFERNVDFQQDIRADGRNPRRRGSLYIASTAILPEAQGKGLGTLLKSWQVAYARQHGFTRIVTNTRKSNRAMIRLNKNFGFTVIRTTADYYAEPGEATVVMELLLL